MGLAALAMMPVGMLGGRLIYKVILKTPYYFLVPTIGLVTILGTFALRNSITDVGIMLVLGTVGYLLKEVGISSAPIVLGLILGVIGEVGFVQSMLRGAASPYPIVKLFENPLSKVLIALTLVSAGWPYISIWVKRWRARGEAQGGDA
jgi:putative tricarboxylic transport membrane protein